MCPHDNRTLVTCMASREYYRKDVQFHMGSICMASSLVPRPCGLGTRLHGQYGINNMVIHVGLIQRFAVFQALPLHDTSDWITYVPKGSIILHQTLTCANVQMYHIACPQLSLQQALSKFLAKCFRYWQAMFRPQIPCSTIQPSSQIGKLYGH